MLARVPPKQELAYQRSLIHFSWVVPSVNGSLLFPLFLPTAPKANFSPRLKCPQDPGTAQQEKPPPGSHLPLPPAQSSQRVREQVSAGGGG